MKRMMEPPASEISRRTALSRSSNECSDVESEDSLVLEAVGDVAVSDSLGETFDDGGLAHTWFADEDGVVLGSS